MSKGITDVAGVRVGHWTHPSGTTGCTVVLLPAGTVAAGEVRGGAPGTREWALLAPERLVDRVDAVVLTGGSAFGLATCDGVVRYCEERGMGFPTRAGPVPIVVGMVLFDLVGAVARPGPDAGYAACVAAGTGPVACGRVGAGAGATIGTWRGPRSVRPGGLGSASVRHGDLVVGAVMAVNAFGEVVEAGTVPAGEEMAAAAAVAFAENTTIGVVATNARLDKCGCLLVAQSAQDALARVIVPAHSLADGDAIVAAATGSLDASVELVRVLAGEAVVAAVRAAVA